jgi:ketosteroid isomerase-like protein
MITDQLTSRRISIGHGVALLVGGFVSHSRAKAETNDAEVRSAHHRWFDGLVSGDVTGLSMLLADDMTFHTPGGAAETKANFLENIRAGRLRYQSIAPQDQRLRVHGDTAIVTGRVSIRYRWQDAPVLERLYYTAVYGKWNSSRWKLLAWQSTYQKENGLQRLSK